MANNFMISPSAVIDNSSFSTPLNIAQHVDQVSSPSPPLSSCNDVSDHVHDLFEYVLDLWISSIICYSGVIGNVMALVVFAKMGFQNTINISLTSIVLWDLIKCIGNVLLRVYGPIELISPIDAQNWKSIAVYICGYSYTFAGYISGILASYVALERCICVSLPFTVKFLLTQKVVILVNVAAPLLVFGFHGIVFEIIGFTYMYSSKFNASVAVIHHKPSFYKYPAIDVYTSIMSMLSPMFSFAVMTICTIIISVFLRRASKIRTSIKMAAAKDGERVNQLSARDRQVIKMLLAVISVYIATYVPKIIFYTVTIFTPKLRVTDCLSNYTWILLYFMSFTDNINAIVNPFIFYFMSSIFKKTFLTVFKCQSSK